MLNWNWSHTISTSVVSLAIVSSLASHSAQAQTVSSEIKSTHTSTSLATPEATSNLKVGETRSQALSKGKDESIARIYSHQVDGKKAATVYVRGIPVVTYIESDEVTEKLSATTKTNSNSSEKTKGLTKSEVKGETKKNSDSLKSPSTTINSETNLAKASEDTSESLLLSANPIERATAAAALINQLNRDGLDASQIIPAWKNGDFVIKLGDRATIKFDEQALSPASLENNAEDVLESANLLRRLLGGASPLSEVANAPKPKVVVANPALSDRIVGVMSGMASWYGPGFDGNYSASGEVFRASDLTAAHPSLPFGSMVRVVNMDNGQSVVVRINDRGPYAHGRVIDISAGAASVIGLISSGVAPVRLEVLSK
ncbi:septal ring lytic transglycosylase RlpA family protein [Pseudanabaena mucicola]|uniref:Probable endolytic peptidoglycan transglycosylase RlpA n=1 Tax=Pseudanabaena mucicola FACHB-723 TaxID=2692860 RepID=A0ABR7ZU88_9CYAN|nr:septal ring lytic transglycosylase RlpA family protein [Pseudanabaena mucicola]MBD2186958.1 septal ring lytic transglycosylase RlpA family protein [Pseudanabaena mucicola FACHB-723]